MVEASVLSSEKEEVKGYKAHSGVVDREADVCVCGGGVGGGGGGGD